MEDRPALGLHAARHDPELARRHLAAAPARQGRGRYKRHPDPAQERLFFTLLGECLDNGSVPSALLETEIARGHIRTDAHDCIAQAQRAAA